MLRDYLVGLQVAFMFIIILTPIALLSNYIVNKAIREHKVVNR